MTDQKSSLTAPVIPVILCGGSGTRLWPASREQNPKQFLSLMDDFSLLQNTLRRAMRVSGAPASNVVTVTLGALKDKVAQQLGEINADSARHILSEPTARNTAAAIAFAAAYVRRTFGEDAILWVLPSDHHMGDENALSAAMEHGRAAAANGALVTFGITPTRPDVGYGYIRAAKENRNGVFAVEQFVEKPDLETAQAYLQSGDYLWNSGMFVFSAKSVLDEFAAYAPSILRDVTAAMNGADAAPSADLYARVEKQPFDKAVMEKSARVAVVPCNPQWSDIGSWESLWEIREKDMNENVIEGRAACFNAKRCLVQGNGRLIAIAGLDDVVVIETGDALLIANKTDGTSMKSLIEALKKSGAPEAVQSAPQPQAWAMFKDLESENTLQAQEITLQPGDEKQILGNAQGLCILTVTDGVATLSANGKTSEVPSYQTVTLPLSSAHTLSNRTGAPLSLIMVQKHQKEDLALRKAA